MSTILSVKNLQVRYPLNSSLSLPFKKPAFVDVVRGVSLDIKRGETLAIVGESGSGKTTLAMAICGLTPIQAGEVYFDGKPVVQDKTARLMPNRRRIALMFQDPVGSLSPRMTVRKLLSEPASIHAVNNQNSDQEARRLLSLVGLSPDFADRYPHQLSGGQARRVGVARALALKPEVLIADEPTAGLDVSVQGEILNLLSELQTEMGLGIMVITHNLSIVRHVADTMAIMYLGRFVEQGNSQVIFNRPRHPYTEALLSANPSPDPDAKNERVELRGEIPGLLQRPSGCEFHTRCPWVQADCKNTDPPTDQQDIRQSFRCLHPRP